MKKKKNGVFVICGLLLLLTGFYMIKGLHIDAGMARTCAYLFIAFGCGLFGKGIGDIIAGMAVGSDRALEKKMRIEANDERNLAVSRRAKSRAYDLMVFVFGALMLSFALMGMDLTPILLLVAAYLFIQAAAIYYQAKYEKEM